MIAVLDWLTVGLGVISTVLFYKIIRIFLTPRKSRVLKGIALLCLLNIVNIVIFTYDMVNIFGVLIGFLLYVNIFYKGGWIRKVSIVIVLYPMIVSANHMTYELGYQVFKILPDQSLIYSTFTNMGSHAARVVLWFLTWRFCRKFVGSLLDFLDTRMWILIDCICISVFTAILVTLNFLPEDHRVAYPVEIASIVTGLGCLYLAGYIAASLRNETQLKTLQAEYDYYEEKLRDEERVRSVYHDMKNHLLLLKSEQADEQVDTMIDTISEQISDYENYFKTDNTFLDIIVQDKARKARDRSIDFLVMVHFEDGSFIDPLDISAIFGNALDNALEASMKLPASERMITVKGRRIRDMLSVVIENNAAEKLIELKQTEKPDKLLHGLGLGSIEKAVRKYEGSSIVKQEAGHFQLKIIIPIPEELVSEG